MAELTQIGPDEFAGIIVQGGGARKVEVRVAPTDQSILVRTNVYDGVRALPWPQGQSGTPPVLRGYDPRAVAERELARLQALADAGRSLWED